MGQPGVRSGAVGELPGRPDFAPSIDPRFAHGPRGRDFAGSASWAPRSGVGFAPSSSPCGGPPLQAQPPDERGPDSPGFHRSRIYRSRISMSLAISVENLSKCYCIGAHANRGYRTLRESMLEAAAASRRHLRTLWRLGRAPGSEVPSRDMLWALKDASFEVKAGRGGRHHRPQRRRQVDAAEDPQPDHRADRRPRPAPRPDRQPAGGRDRIPPRIDRPGEHLPQRRDPGHEPPRDRAPVRRDRRVRRDRQASSTRRSSATRAACTCGWPSPSPPTWIRTSC